MITTIHQHTQLVQEANKITNRNTLYAAGVGLLPFPVIDAAALLGVQLSMIQSISKLYGIPFKKHIVKSLIGSLAGSAGSVGLVKMIPGLGTILGGITTSVAGAAATYALGKVFTQHFDQGGTLLDFDPIKSRKYFEEQYEEGKAFVEQEQESQAASKSYGTASYTTEKSLLLAETNQLQEDLTHLQATLATLKGKSPKKVVVLKRNASTENTNFATETLPTEVLDDTIDFTMIEGIGPKIDKVLKEAELDSMKELSKMEISKIQELLDKAEGDFSFADPTSWPQQAALIATGKMDALKALQNQLISKKK